jgi:hypothetical protein
MAITPRYRITNEKISVFVHHHLGADILCIIMGVQMYWLMVKWLQAIVMQCLPHAALWNTET